MSRYPRRTFLVNKRLQLKMSGILFVLVCVYSFCLGYTLIEYSRGKTALAQENLVVSDVLKRELQKNEQTFLVSTITILSVNGVLIILLGILATHRIAGPLYRLERFADTIRHKDYSQVLQFRKGDELMPLATRINEMTAALKASMQDDLESLSFLYDTLSGVRAQIEGAGTDPGVREDLRKAIDRVDVLLAQKR